ncbi:MAG: glycosyltransferase family 4 protein [Acidimicrobiales bacterium]
MEVSARVQERSVGLLPERVRAHVVGDSDGVKRAMQAVKPVERSVPRDGTVVHGLDVDLPLGGSRATVATVHDLAVFDVPWTFEGFRSRGERALLSFHLNRADALISVSNFTAERLRERFGLESTVVHIAPSRDVVEPTDAQVAAVRKRLQLPDRFVLYVGTVEPRKDVAALAEACRRIHVPLLIAGRRMTALPDEDNVRSLGYVDSADLAPLMVAAAAVGYPSVYEGFGLPPLEALQAGAVSVSTSVGALPEVLGSFDYPLVPAGDKSALVELLGDVVADESFRAGLLTKGRRALGHLGWERTARETVQVYQKVSSTTEGSDRHG